MCEHLIDIFPFFTMLQIKIKPFASMLANFFQITIPFHCQAHKENRRASLDFSVFYPSHLFSDLSLTCIIYLSNWFDIQFVLKRQLQSRSEKVIFGQMVRIIQANWPSCLCQFLQKLSFPSHLVGSKRLAYAWRQQYYYDRWL